MKISCKCVCVMDGSTQLRGILENIMYLRVSNFLIVSDTGEVGKISMARMVRYRKVDVSYAFGSPAN